MRLNISKPSPVAREKINALLKQVNGKAYMHCYHSCNELQKVAEFAEDALCAINLPVDCRKGTVARMISGDNLPNAYKWTAGIIRTQITIERGVNDWFLIDCKRCEGLRNVQELPQIVLTQEQKRSAVASMYRKLNINVVNG